MTIIPEHCRAARALLDWTLDDLSRESGVAVKTIVSFEKGQRTPYLRTLRDIREAFEDAGIVFTNGDEPGVRLRRSSATTGNGERVAVAPTATPRKPKRQGVQVDWEEAIS